MRMLAATFCAAALLACAPAATIDTGSPPGPMVHTTMSALPAGMSWGPGPASLPPGAQLAVLDGDPTQDQLYTIRVRFPANYMVPPHMHPKWEHVTVISGELHFGMGRTVNMATAPLLRPGEFRAIRPNEPHFVHTMSEVVLQLHGMGPFTVTYVNEADDPRRR